MQHFTEDLKEDFRPADTKASKRFMRERWAKEVDISPGIFLTPAMNSNKWKRVNTDLCHILIHMRMAACDFYDCICYQHGFHTISHIC
jgi:hypothetical protein